MHSNSPSINLNEVLEAPPIETPRGLRRSMWWCFWVGLLVFCVGLVMYPHNLLWAAYYTSAVFFMGLSVGGVVISVIFQIVRATWPTPVRRIAEAGVAYFPWAFLSILVTYFGRHELFPWANHPMPGKEWWMQPNFVYSRNALLLAFMFYMLCRFVRLSLRGDIGLLRERFANQKRWVGWPYPSLVKNWQGSAVEVPALQNAMSRIAPVLIFIYAICYSLFTFEMVMAMDPMWISNLFGGFYFIGNIYIGFAMMMLLSYYLTRINKDYAKVISPDARWDMGKLTFGFCIFWGYFFFSQFLPQWYGNLPEETQYMILRTREYPWKSLGWITFSMCFVIPLILLLSRDVKKTGATAAATSIIILIGVWIEKYMAIMPNISPTVIPFGVMEFGIFLGFLGMYVLSIMSFLSKYPFVPVSHPQTLGKDEW